jgi:hypothetical protein
LHNQKYGALLFWKFTSWKWRVGKLGWGKCSPT